MPGRDEGPVLAGRRALVGVTGGIAAYKAAVLVRLLVEAGARVQVVMTPAATRFVGPDTFAALSRRPVHSDVFERVEEVLHVRLAHEADVAVVAPATANVLAKLALGLADDLLTSTLLEASCPLVVAPAMHTGMFRHPTTQAHLSTLAERGVIVVGPGEGPLAAGDAGLGRMSEPEEVFAAVEAAAGPADLSGQRVLVTAGPTHEPIDPVRFVGNRSSGRMGLSVATEARRRGAEVVLVVGPIGIPVPFGVDVVRVESADEMAQAVFDRYPSVDAVVMAAAVADFRPEQAAPQKIKKEHGPPQLALTPTTDILKTLGKRKEHQILVGFAAETEDLEAAGRRKLVEKNLDYIVINEVGRPGTGFGSTTNRAAILAAVSDDVPLREWTKGQLASAICDRLAARLSAGGAG